MGRSSALGRLLSPPVVARLAGWACGRAEAAGREPPQRILVVRLDEIGDLVLSSPFLRALRGAFPSAQITLVVQPLLVNLVELCPYVDEVLSFEWRTTGRFWKPLRIRRAWGFARRSLRPRGFDLAILPRYGDDHYFAAYVAFFSGAPRRVGYSEYVDATKREVNRGLDALLTTALPPSPHLHEVARNLDLLACLGVEVHEARLETWIGDEDRAFAEALLARRRREGTLVALAPGAGAAARRWPVERFADFGRWAAAELGAHLLALGSPAERALAEPLCAALGDALIDTIGSATLRQAAALLEHCDLFVGNDSGPMHLAAAAGVPIVEISCHPEGGRDDHATSPLRFGPWGVPNVVLRPPLPRDPCRTECEANLAHCILEVDAMRVKDAARRLLAATSRRKV